MNTHEYPEVTRSRRLAWAVISGSILSLLMSPAQAHHSFAGAYDFSKPITLKGTIRSVAWINPHSLVHFVVMRPDGQVEEWTAEVGTPNALARMGLTKSSFHAGIEVVVSGSRARDGSNKMNGKRITTADGKPLFQQGGDR